MAKLTINEVVEGLACRARVSRATVTREAGDCAGLAAMMHEAVELERATGRMFQDAAPARYTGHDGELACYHCPSGHPGL